MIGNYSNDILDNENVKKRGFGYEFSLFQMKRNLEKEIQAVDKPNGEVEIREWKVKSEEEEQMYLRANNRIWPDAPLFPSQGSKVQLPMENVYCFCE
jgi:hypothetical protein